MKRKPKCLQPTLTTEQARRVAGKMEKEAPFMRRVMRALNLYGYRRVHFKPAMSKEGRWATHQDGDDGFPDICAVNPKHPRARIIFVEIKREDEYESPGQMNWLNDLCYSNAGRYVHAFVLRPSDWDWFIQLISWKE
jgi:hypothetical protein